MSVTPPRLHRSPKCRSPFRGRSVALACLCVVTLATCRQATAADRPNFLIILADDMGYSDLGCYGSEIATPNLDSLAAGGLRFTQAYNTARCWPSRAALLTGFYAQQVRRDSLPGSGGGGGNRWTRPAWAKLLPEYLRPHGYRNYHSGKWHIDGNVLDGGFDRSLDTRNQGNFFSARGNRLDDRPIEPPADEDDYYTTIATADHAIECLQDHARNHADQPFLQYVAFIAPHFPLHALPADIHRYRDRYLDGWDRLREQRFARQRELGLIDGTLSPLEPEIGPPYHFPEALKKLGPGEVNRPLPWADLNDQQRRFQATKMAIHAAMVDRMDHEIGRILAQLRQNGALENTVILFASDNGASAEIMVRDGGHDRTAAAGSAATYLCLGPGFSSAANTPLRRHKTWVHEGGISTPLIVHWPAGIAARGELRQSPVHFVDIVPTVLELAGAEWPVAATNDNQATPDAASVSPAPDENRPAEIRVPGVSLVPEFATPGAIDRESLWWLHEGNRAIRVGDWKLVAAKDQPWELYDLSRDRSETHDLAGEHPDKVEQLAARWEAEATAIRQAFARETRAEVGSP